MVESLPPGFRFHPTDEELITYYLSHRVTDPNFAPRAVTDVDLNKCEPWDLPGKAIMGEKEWYFFSPRDRKYPTGFRTNRATESGYWKTTGKDKEVFHNGLLVGMKKTLVFYKGRAPSGEKTSWVMHEYRLQSMIPYRPTKEEWVVCRVFKKNSNISKKQQDNSPPLPSLLESPRDTAPMSELGEIDASVLNSFMYQTNDSSSASSNANNGIDMRLYTNWALLAREATSRPVLPWPPSILGSIFAAAPAVLKPLAFSGYQSLEATDAVNLNPFGGQGDPTSFHGSSFRGVVSSQQQQQQQPFNDQESIW